MPRGQGFLPVSVSQHSSLPAFPALLCEVSQEAPFVVFVTGCAVVWWKSVSLSHPVQAPGSGGCLGAPLSPRGGTACGCTAPGPAVRCAVPTPVFAVVLLQPELSPSGE